VQASFFGVADAEQLAIIVVTSLIVRLILTVVRVAWWLRANSGSVRDWRRLRVTVHTLSIRRVFWPLILDLASGIFDMRPILHANLLLVDRFSVQNDPDACVRVIRILAASIPATHHDTPRTALSAWRSRLCRFRQYTTAGQLSSHLTGPIGGARQNSTIFTHTRHL
jgi:hypothetical protein